MDMNVAANHVATNFSDIADHRDEAVFFERAAPVRKPAAAVATPATCGAGWYHDAAIATASKDAIDKRSNPYRA